MQEQPSSSKALDYQRKKHQETYKSATKFHYYIKYCKLGESNDIGMSKQVQKQRTKPKLLKQFSISGHRRREEYKHFQPQYLKR